jgi:cell division protein FtsI (penicillin-binding protein 3)
MTGEVLAMVNQPSFNPNNRRDRDGRHFRNRAVTDVFEPGSTIKPFTIAAALKSGRYKPGTAVETAPGTFKVGNNTIHDTRNYGRIDVATVIQKSSNVGVSKIALSLEPQQLWLMLSNVGFGSVTLSGFPGESTGRLSDYHSWYEIERATLSFGYGMSATALQLANAYAVLARDGVYRPVTFIYGNNANTAQPQRVMQQRISRQLRSMLESAVGDEGTGSRARIPGYRVAGKTGTVRKSGVGGYQEDRYTAVFAGMAPASKPRMVMVVVVNEPSNGEYYGGHVAAPVFARVMFDALRLMNVAPDDLDLLADGGAAAEGGKL